MNWHSTGQHVHMYLMHTGTAKDPQVFSQKVNSTLNTGLQAVSEFNTTSMTGWCFHVSALV